MNRTGNWEWVKNVSAVAPHMLPTPNGYIMQAGMPTLTIVRTQSTARAPAINKCKSKQRAPKFTHLKINFNAILHISRGYGFIYQFTIIVQFCAEPPSDIVLQTLTFSLYFKFIGVAIWNLQNLSPPLWRACGFKVPAYKVLCSLGCNVPSSKIQVFMQNSGNTRFRSRWLNASHRI